jgi:hypothetical protein
MTQRQGNRLKLSDLFKLVTSAQLTVLLLYSVVMLIIALIIILLLYILCTSSTDRYTILKIMLLIKFENRKAEHGEACL